MKGRSIMGMGSHTMAGVGARPTPAPTGAVPLTATRLFNGLSSWDIAEIMGAAIMRGFPRGQTIIRADDPGTELFLIKTGSVDFYRVTPEGKQVLIIRFSPGDNFGFTSLLAKPVGYLGTAEAVEKSDLYIWGHTWVRSFAGKHPVLTENALRIGLEYIKMYSDRHLALVSDNVEDRLRSTLSQLEIRSGQRHGKGLEIEITNERLAALADIGYYTTSRLLNKWERKGALEKSRGKVIVIAPERMVDSPTRHKT